MNWTLFKKEIKSNYKMVVIFMGVLALYASMTIAMFDPALGDSLQEMAASMPQIFAAFGMADVGATLVEFVSNYLYNFLFVAFPAVCIIILSNRLVVRYVDQGSMAYLLATPNTRKKIVFTQMKVSAVALFALVFFISVFTAAVCYLMFPGELALAKFILLNVGLYGLLIFLGGLCFCASCWFNDSKRSYGVSGGFVIAFILVQMISQVGEKFEFLRYATPLTLFDTKGLIAGESQSILLFLILYLVGIALYFLGMAIFCRKDLPI